MGDKLFWERYFKTYDILNEAIPYQKLLGDFIKALNMNKGDLILDAGSGTGNLCIRLKECGAIPVGLDFSEKAVEIHREKDPSAIIYLYDLTDRLPFPDECFDKIVSNNVLYTIDRGSRLSVIKEFYRILKPNGKIVIANVHTGFNPMRILIDHIRESYKTKGLFKITEEILKKGFLVIKMFYYSYCLIRKTMIGKYAFVEPYEQRNLLRQAGFREIGETIKSYSDQSYLDVGIK